MSSISLNLLWNRTAGFYAARAVEFEAVSAYIKGYVEITPMDSKTHDRAHTGVPSELVQSQANWRPTSLRPLKSWMKSFSKHRDIISAHLRGCGFFVWWSPRPLYPVMLYHRLRRHHERARSAAVRGGGELTCRTALPQRLLQCDNRPWPSHLRRRPPSLQHCMLVTND